jgi:hypothetical protein
MDEYTRGQIDLIKVIKEKVSKLEDTTTIQNFPFDMLHLLKNIKPIQK